MTGESLPVDKGVGEEVFCGTINRFGAIDIRATKVGKDSSLQKLIRMVQSADFESTPNAESTRFSRCFAVQAEPADMYIPFAERYLSITSLFIEGSEIETT